MTTPPIAPEGEGTVWRSECCNAPIVILRSDTSVFDYAPQEPSEALEEELEGHGVGDGSEFWMDDYVRVYHHACACCRQFTGDPWIEENLDKEAMKTELTRLRERERELVEVLKSAKREIKRLSENGTDRILFLGGKCDPWEKTAEITISRAGIDAALAKP